MDQPKQVAKRPHEPNRCLVVDDIRSSHRLLEGWLTPFEIECVSATDGEQAWGLLQRGPFDLVVTDIEMPRCSGLELLSRIRRTDSVDHSRTPVLIMTSLVDQNIERAVQQFGGDGLLIKPLDKKSTFSTVLELLGKGVSSEQWRSYAHREINAESSVISPETLRRLLRTVAEIERSE